jgi:hypothetical protein
MRTAKTHFEQIPVETVKNIAKELPEDNAIGQDPVVADAHDEGRSQQERWREVAKTIQREQDPQKMIELVQQLIATYDEEQQGERLPPTRKAGTQSRSSETSPVDFPRTAD